MTIIGWILFGMLCVVLLSFGVALYLRASTKLMGATAIIVSLIVCVLVFLGFRWYFTSTASGVRALTDERSDLMNGLDRTITVYTANGDKIAEYVGKIDLEMDQDYVKFDWNGKRYIYYNCFIETIADIP